MPRSLRPGWIALASLLGCAARSPSPTAAPSGRTVEATSASAPEDVTIAGRDPPLYKPSSRSRAPMPITVAAYGAYAGAPAAPTIGDRVSDFELPLADGGAFRLADARAAGPVVIVFYRGFW